VTTLQARRPDESVIATLVGYGCHPVTTGYDMYVYSADYPGPLRRVVRATTGGDCIFFQGAGGTFCHDSAFHGRRVRGRADGDADRDRGARSVADRLATPVELIRLDRVGHADLEVPPCASRGRGAALAACRGRLDPADAPPAARGSRRLREGTTAVSTPRGAPATSAGQGCLLPRELARRIEEQLARGDAPTQVEGPVHAVRIATV